MGSRLTDGFREVIELRWSEFVELENSVDATNYDSIIAAIIRAAGKGSLRAIQTGLDRLDGKIATEIAIEYPKFFTLYPYADKTTDDPTIIDADRQVSESVQEAVMNIETDPDIREIIGSPADMDELQVTEEELPTGSLRVVLEKMLDSPKTIVSSILATAERVDEGDLAGGDPKVKSVMVAGLMKLVHDRKISAVFEVFDQIDGKVAEKFKVLGSDVYMTSYAGIAPAGAYLNENGVYQMEAENVTSQWATRLEQTNKKR